MNATQQPTDIETLREVRRLLVEREAKKRELDAIDRAISLAVGLDDNDRPKHPRLSRSQIRTLARTPHERLPAKKRQPMDSGLV